MSSKLFLVDNFSTHVIPSIQLLEQQRSMIYKIRVSLSIFLTQGGNSQVEGIEAGAYKNLLLADIEDLNRAKDDYYKNSIGLNTTESQREIQEFNKISNQFILNIIHYAHLKDLQKSPEELLNQKTKLEASQKKLENFIFVLISKNYNTIKKDSASISNEINKITPRNIILISLGVILATLISIVMARLIYSPIIQLSQMAERIASGDFSKEIKVYTHDEIEILANAMSLMLERTLLTARQAGMAEIASSVLHNIGNILNSINVSANSLTEKIRNTHLDGLSAASKLIQEHLKDFDKFVTEDPKGKALIPYIEALPQFWNEKKSMFLNEIASVTKYIDNVKEIIAMQQSMSKSISIIETVRIDSVIDEALNLNKANFLNIKIDITRDYQTQVSILIDRIKLLQILVNLLRNAYESVTEADLSERKITVSLKDLDTQCICIQIIDNGKGIKPEEVTKIFSYGFTTRKKGHGLGLHNTLLTTKELGGSLAFESQGAGKGATFTLVLPKRADQNKEHL